MTIRHDNEILLSTKRDGSAPSVIVDGNPVLIKDLNSDDFRDLPVVLKCGAVNYKIGHISSARIGRNTIYGDLVLALTGSLKLEPIHNEENEIIGAKPVKYEFVSR